MILLALGSNLGDRQANLEAALLRLQAAGVHVQHVSSVYETAALLPDNAPPEWDISYYNIVCAVETTLAPDALLRLVKDMEILLGRKDIGHWGPRLIDIDILAHGDTVREEEHLTLPHAAMLSRDFVMLPLTEIAPHWVHPVALRPAHEITREAGMQIGAGIMRLPLLLQWRPA